MSDSVLEFYDQLADHYADIFADWQAAVFRQGETLDDFIRAQGYPPPATLLDCTCGIGTQAIGLALRGYRVQATDLSPVSIARARDYAARFGVNTPFGVADLRGLSAQVDGQFDAVVSFDNGLPHLLTDGDLRLAANHLYAKVKPGGCFIASIRDYDQTIQEKPRSTLPRVYDSSQGRRIIFQVWDWAEDGRSYTLQHFIVHSDAAGWKTIHGSTVYRALLRDELSAFLRDAGFTAIRWHMPGETGYYQPVVTARRG